MERDLKISMSKNLNCKRKAEIGSFPYPVDPGGSCEARENEKEYPENYP
jgi:hypothetical protein